MPARLNASEDRQAAIQSFEIASIDELLRSVTGPLKVVAQRLEQVRLRLSHGQDPAAALGCARDELEKAFVAFEIGRARLRPVQTVPNPSLHAGDDEDSCPRARGAL
jgi:hypothetical protein